MKTCRKCGCKIPDQANFCTQCGTSCINDSPGNRTAYNSAPDHGSATNHNQPNRRRKSRAPLIAGVLVIALLFVMIGYPGYLRESITYYLNGGSGDGGRKAGGDITGSDFNIDGVDVISSDGMAADQFAGNSKAVDVTPVEGIHITAAENAMDKDREVKVAPLSEEVVESYSKACEESGQMLLGCYDISLGLENGEALPGTFKTELDMSGFGLTDSLKEKVNVYRIDDEGLFHEYNTFFEGDKLCFNSSHNCGIAVTVTAICIGLPLVFSIGTRVKEGVDSLKPYFGATIPNNKEVRCGSRVYKLYWKDSDLVTETETVKKRMGNREKLALDEAKKIVARNHDNETDASSPGGLMEFFRKLFDKSDDNLAALKEQEKILEKDKVYQGLKKESEQDEPMEIREITKIVETADAYISSDRTKGTNPLKLPSYVVECVCFVQSTNDSSGSAETHSPLLKKDWVAVCYNGLIRPGADDYDVSKDIRDDILITFTHEFFHVCQDEYYHQAWSGNVKLSEMTADYLESDAYNYASMQNSV